MTENFDTVSLFKNLTTRESSSSSNLSPSDNTSMHKQNKPLHRLLQLRQAQYTTHVTFFWVRGSHNEMLRVHPFSHGEDLFSGVHLAVRVVANLARTADP
jgi:hypothetical protein